MHLPCLFWPLPSRQLLLLAAGAHSNVSVNRPALSHRSCFFFHSPRKGVEVVQKRGLGGPMQGPPASPSGALRGTVEHRGGGDHAGSMGMMAHGGKGATGDSRGEIVDLGESAAVSFRLFAVIIMAFPHC